MCHDVLLFELNGQEHYSGSSQDEVNLLEAARDSGIAKLVYRDSERIIIKIINEDGIEVEEKYKILKVFEFTSERKLMSIVF